MRKVILRTIISLLVMLISVLVSVLVFFTCTQAGLQLLLRFVSHQTSQQFQAQAISGHLLGKMHLKNIRYHQDKLQLAIDDLVLDWHIKTLFPFTIDLSTGNLTSVAVSYPQPQEYRIQQMQVSGQIIGVVSKPRQLTWNLALSAKQINLAAVKESNLSLEIQSTGLITSSQHQYLVNLQSLTGHIKQFP
ncbi:MAG: hypothetical protein K2Q14_01360, partial [Gammaproteobacteria bacterium]|nr:hypothetical protein [Gammaproteobacteria bacterium]